MKVRVPISGTVGKAVFFDPEAGARAEAAVAALAAQISGGLGAATLHSSLRNLQVGDDHPQYTGWQFPETIVGLWNFQTIPQIQGETLAEYIEEVVGGSFFDFLQDTSSVVWTYRDTAGELEANVPPEFVQDTVGAMLTDTSSIDLSYNDGAGTFQAAIIDEYVQDLVGAMFSDSTSIDFTYSDLAGTITASTINANPTGTVGLAAVNGTAATPMRSDGAPALSQAIAPTWSGQHVFSLGPRVITNGTARYFMQNTAAPSGTRTWEFRVNNAGDCALVFDDDSFNGIGSALVFKNTSGNTQLVSDGQELQLGAGQDLRLYHDGADSFIRNDTGVLNINEGATTVGRFDTNGTAGNTRFMVYDVDNAALERVSVGAADSGGTGFKVLRIPN